MDWVTQSDDSDRNLVVVVLKCLVRFVGAVKETRIAILINSIFVFPQNSATWIVAQLVEKLHTFRLPSRFNHLKLLFFPFDCLLF